MHMESEQSRDTRTNFFSASLMTNTTKSEPHKTVKDYTLKECGLNLV